jgi:hypothetical protein
MIASKSCRLNAPAMAWSVATVGTASVKVTPVGSWALPACRQG